MPPIPPTTTIPIVSNVGETISQSTQNLFSRRLLWQDFFNTFDAPTSLSDAYTRYRINGRRHFFPNYLIILTMCIAASIMGYFITLLMFALILHLWLNLHVFSEDRVILWGRHVSSWVIMLGMVLVAVTLVWLFRTLSSDMWWTGFEVGIVVTVVHAVFKNPDGGYVVEEDGAVSNGATTV